MPETELVKKLKQILEKILGRQEISLSLNTKFSEIEGLDSVEILCFVSEIEEQFDVLIEDEAMYSMESISDLIGAIRGPNV